MAHVEALSVAHAVFLVSPFAGGGRREIVRRPQVYGFDTGFVTFVKGWDKVREDDRGVLWEHLVLDELRARVDERTIAYWRWVDVPYGRRYGELAVAFGTPADLLSAGRPSRAPSRGKSRP
jgi:hypothetical protein